MRHHQTYDLSDPKYHIAWNGSKKDIGSLIYKNFNYFLHNNSKLKNKLKSQDEQIFDELSVSELNDHLRTLMPGLSAKVFRTFNASSTLEKQLPDILSDGIDGTLVAEKVVIYNAANRKVAILCNHQKTYVIKAADHIFWPRIDGRIIFVAIFFTLLYLQRI